MENYFKGDLHNFINESFKGKELTIYGSRDFLVPITNNEGSTAVSKQSGVVKSVFLKNTSNRVYLDISFDDGNTARNIPLNMIINANYQNVESEPKVIPFPIFGANQKTYPKLNLTDDDSYIDIPIYIENYDPENLEFEFLELDENIDIKEILYDTADNFYSALDSYSNFRDLLVFRIYLKKEGHITNLHPKLIIKDKSVKYGEFTFFINEK
jgi:hypothetical protein